ncbi:MAG TPA: hypothetical protein PLV92_27380, partial [Pirellulaceae bacterium]|nr:hypothetical protein [Pirellulaceae bacterium]
MTGAVGATNSLSTLTATASSLTLGTSLKTTGAISLTADTIALPTAVNTVTGGSITIQTQTASRRLDIVATETGSNLELTPAEIASLKDGFSSVTLGRADGTGGISVATPVTFNDPVTLRSPNGGTINVAGQITGAGNSSVTLTSGASGLIQISSNIVTAGQAVALTGPVLLAADVSIDTTNSGSVTSGAAISFSSTVDSSSATARSLQLLGGTGGAVTMTGAVGATNPLSSLQVTASSLTFGTSLATTGAITLTADRLALPTTVDSVSGGSITIQTQTASRRLDIVASEIGSNLELTPAEIAALKNGFSSITLGRSNGTGGINVGTSAIFNDPVTLRSPNGGTIDIAAGITGVGDA